MRPSTGVIDTSSAASLQAPSARAAGRDVAAPANDDPKCAEAPDVAPVEVELGKTARTADALAITYGGMEHDNLEGGRADLIVTLTFQGVMDDGMLTPSAFTWRPSVMGPPSWVHLGSMPICVRVSRPAHERVTVEVFRRPAR